jgi:type II secretory pathway pseudopilin PulG
VFAALGTVAAVIVALWQVYREREARMRQEREALERERRAQAERISAWPFEWGEGQTAIVLLNRSEEPVYRAVASLVMIQGAGPRSGKEIEVLELRGWQETLSVIPPGKYYAPVAGGWAGMMRRPGAELAFTDRAGVHWLRSADGSLAAIDQPPVEYYGLELPRSWRIPAEFEEPVT